MTKNRPEPRIPQRPKPRLDLLHPHIYRLTTSEDEHVKARARAERISESQVVRGLIDADMEVPGCLRPEGA